MTRSESDRFGGVGRLYGTDALAALRDSRAVVIGVGGVGSWTVEALARTGVGALVLIDGDDVCVTNTNRQLAALEGTVGLPKVDVLAERVRAIAPRCDVAAVTTFLTAANLLELVDERADVVVDCIDAGRTKAAIAARCRELRLPLVTSGGAGGRRDPTRIRRDDLARAVGDPLLASLRRTLRGQHGFPRSRVRMGVRCVYSDEPFLPPAAGEPRALDCATGLGTAAFVTGAFGLACAAEAVDLLLAQQRPRSGSEVALPPAPRASIRH